MIDFARIFGRRCYTVPFSHWWFINPGSIDVWFDPWKEKHRMVLSLSRDYHRILNPLGRLLYLYLLPALHRRKARA